jgi:hypothetical protein
MFRETSNLAPQLCVTPFKCNINQVDLVSTSEKSIYIKRALSRDTLHCVLKLFEAGFCSASSKYETCSMMNQPYTGNMLYDERLYKTRRPVWDIEDFPSTTPSLLAPPYSGTGFCNSDQIEVTDSCFYCHSRGYAALRNTFVS